MAIFIGCDSSYIKSKRTWSIIKLLVLYVILAIGMITGILFFRSVWYISPIIFVIAVIAAITRIFQMVGVSSKNVWGAIHDFFHAENGLEGEDAIRQSLAALPDTYSVFRGIQPEGTFDVDFTVVGPNGVFAVEVKSHSGELQFHSGSLGLKMVRQARKEAMAMHRFLLQNWKTKLFVYSFLALSRAKIGGPRAVESVMVVSSPDLAQAILNTRGTNPDPEGIKRYLFIHTPK